MTWGELINEAYWKTMILALGGLLLGMIVTSVVVATSSSDTPRVDPDVCQVFAIAAADQSSEDYPFVLIKGTEVGCFHVGEGE